MEPAAPTDVFDFLYRDTSRIASYSAQLFGGRIAGVETAALSRVAKETALKASISLAGGERKSVDDKTTSRKEQIDPHDTAAIDLIAKLIENRTVTAASSRSPNGVVVRAEGRLLFTDAAAIKMLAGMEEDVFRGLMPDRGQKPHEAKKQVKQLRALMQGVDIPSMFLLVAVDGTRYAGTVKVTGLEEPIGSYYYRHGGDGLPGVTVLGICEQPEPVAIPESMAFAKATALFADAMRSIVLPPEVVRLTPIVIYRKLGQRASV